MGYFSNNDEGDCYEADWCRRCVHRDDASGCPVMFAHAMFAYEECNSASNAKKILDLLIPREGIANKRCAMFVAADRVVRRHDPSAQVPIFGEVPRG